MHRGLSRFIVLEEIASPPRLPFSFARREYIDNTLSLIYQFLYYLFRYCTTPIRPKI